MTESMKKRLKILTNVVVFLLVQFCASLLVLAQPPQEDPRVTFSLRRLFPQFFINSSTEADNRNIEAIFNRWKDRFLVGREVEFTEKKLANLMRYFDFSDVSLDQIDEVKRWKWRSEQYKEMFGPDLDGYLFLKGTLEDIQERFPEEYQILTQNLELGDILKSEHNTVEGRNSPIITPEKEKLLNPGLDIPPEVKGGFLLSDEGSAAINKERVHRSSEKKVLLVEKKSEEKGSLYSLNWQALNARWNSFKIEEQVRMVNFGLLPDTIKARFFSFLIDDHFQKEGKIRRDGESTEVLSNLEFSRDGSAIEFRDKKPYSDMAQFLRSLRLFAERSGTLSSIWNPALNFRMSTSFHFHFSVSNLPSDYDMKTIVKQINLLLLLRSIKMGFLDTVNYALASKNQGTLYYSSEVISKGLLRLADRNRVEMRFHLDDPVTELQFLAELFSLPFVDAYKILNKQIKDLANPGITKFIADQNKDAHHDLLVQKDIENLADAEIADLLTRDKINILTLLKMHPEKINANMITKIYPESVFKFGTIKSLLDLAISNGSPSKIKLIFENLPPQFINKFLTTYGASFNLEQRKKLSQLTQPIGVSCSRF